MSNMVTTGQEMVRGKKTSSRSGESQGISLQVSGNFMNMNHHIGHEIEQQTDGGFSKKSILFARYCLGATLYQFMYTACVWLKA